MISIGFPKVSVAASWATRLKRPVPMDAPVRCYRCPSCHSSDVDSTVKTHLATYCRCRACGQLWHEERTEPPKPTHERRRRTDLPR